MIKTTYNNCMVWAIYHWLRYGGYLVIRRAHVPGRWYPHFMWNPKGSKDLLHFAPLDESRWFPWPIFKGHVKIGDWENVEL